MIAGDPAYFRRRKASQCLREAMRVLALDDPADVEASDVFIRGTGDPRLANAEYWIGVAMEAFRPVAPPDVIAAWEAKMAPHMEGHADYPVSQDDVDAGDARIESGEKIGQLIEVPNYGHGCGGCLPLPGTT